MAVAKMQNLSTNRFLNIEYQLNDIGQLGGSRFTLPVKWDKTHCQTLKVIPVLVGAGIDGRPITSALHATNIKRVPFSPITPIAPV